jgi:hypothetical protein
MRKCKYCESVSRAGARQGVGDTETVYAWMAAVHGSMVRHHLVGSAKDAGCNAPRIVRATSVVEVTGPVARNSQHGHCTRTKQPASLFTLPAWEL